MNNNMKFIANSWADCGLYGLRGREGTSDEEDGDGRTDRLKIARDGQGETERERERETVRRASGTASFACVWSARQFREHVLTFMRHVNAELVKEYSCTI